MQKSVANIITNSNKIDFEFKYNKCKSLEEIDVSLPTLIIGYNNAKRYIKNFNILNKAYPEQKIWWTFLKTEKRVDYDEYEYDKQDLLDALDELTDGSFDGAAYDTIKEFIEHYFDEYTFKKGDDDM